MPMRDTNPPQRKCELCPQPSMPTDILCYRCGVNFDPNPPTRELDWSEAFDRTRAAARELVRKRGAPFVFK